jgi:hypothetical protein
VISPASSPAGRRLLGRAGVNPDQYQVLIDLFHTLGERKEVTGQLGLDQHALQLTSLGLLLPAGLIALMAFSGMSLGAYTLVVLLVGAMLILVVLLLEASNSFLNPSEVGALAHQPIGDATYFAAKLTYLVLIVLRLELAVSGLPALAGLVKAEARWFYPFTLFGAAILEGLFLALVACALFGLLFRLLPASKIRGAALWLQLGLITVPLLANVAMRPARGLIRAAGPRLTVDLSFLPVAWFGAIGVAGQAPPPIPIGWSAAVGAMVSILFIAFGLRSLSAGYLTRIVGMRRTSGRQRGRPRPARVGRLVRVLTGRPSGRAAVGFLAVMMRRDWQFRRAMAQVVVPFVIGLPVLVAGSKAGSPFALGPPNPIGIVPEILSLPTLMICLVLAYSDQHRGAWVFLLAPDTAITTFARGVYWSLWLPFVALPLAVALPLFIGRWGIVDGLLFTGYSLAVASLLLSAQLPCIEGLPFGSPPRPERTYMMLPVIVFGPVAIAIGWFLQWHLIFSSRPLTAAAAAVFGCAAWLLARRTLAGLEARVRNRLAGLATGLAEV